MLDQSLYNTHPDFHSDVQSFRSVLTAHMNEFVAGRHPDTSEISTFLEVLASRGYSSEHIGAIQHEALFPIFKAVWQRVEALIRSTSVHTTSADSETFT